MKSPKEVAKEFFIKGYEVDEEMTMDELLEEFERLWEEESENIKLRVRKRIIGNPRTKRGR